MCKIQNFPFVEEFFYYPEHCCRICTPETFHLSKSHICPGLVIIRTSMLPKQAIPPPPPAPSVTKNPDGDISGTKSATGGDPLVSKQPFFQSFADFWPFLGEEKSCQNSKKITVFKIFKINYLQISGFLYIFLISGPISGTKIATGDPMVSKQLDRRVTWPKRPKGAKDEGKRPGGQDPEGPDFQSHINLIIVISIFTIMIFLTYIEEAFAGELLATDCAQHLVRFPTHLKIFQFFSSVTKFSFSKLNFHTPFYQTVAFLFNKIWPR